MNEFHFDNLKHAFYAREVFSYFEEIGKKTPKGYKIIYKDFLNAISVLQNKHGKLNWCYKSEEGRWLITTTAFDWFRDVYFAKEKSLIDLDISFFEKLNLKLAKACDDIDLYEYVEFIETDMTLKEFSDFVNRKYPTVRRYYAHYPDKDCLIWNGEKRIPPNVLIDMCKIRYKDKYMEFLEKQYSVYFKILYNYNPY